MSNLVMEIGQQHVIAPNERDALQLKHILQRSMMVSPLPSLKNDEVIYVKSSPDQFVDIEENERKVMTLDEYQEYVVEEQS